MAARRYGSRLRGGSAAALTLGFGCISDNLAGDCDVGEAQLQVELTAGPGANQVSFTFTNSGPDDSSIADVYFDDGTLLSLASIVGGTGVDFEPGASPGDLPAANNASPPLEATAGLVVSLVLGAALLGLVRRSRR